MSIRNLFVCVALVAIIGCSPNGNTEQSAAPTTAAMTDDPPAAAAVTVSDTDEPKTLFTNVNVFDGTSDSLSRAWANTVYLKEVI